MKTETTGRPGRKLHPAASFFLKLGIIAAVILVLHFYVLGAMRIPDNAMYPSAREGDLCIFYQLGTYNVGDLVRYTAPDGTVKTGRICVMQGEFDIRDDRPYLNGARMTETTAYETPKGSYSLPCKITTGQYWIMNDLRKDTSDSRTYGPIDEKDLRGRVMFLFRRRGF